VAICAFGNDGYDGAYIYFGSDVTGKINSIRLNTHDVSGMESYDASAALVVGQDLYHHLGIIVNFADVGGFIHVYVDKQLVLSYSGDTLNPLNDPVYPMLILGDSSNFGGGWINLYIDDIYIDDISDLVAPFTAPPARAFIPQTFIATIDTPDASFENLQPGWTDDADATGDVTAKLDPDDVGYVISNPMIAHRPPRWWNDDSRGRPCTGATRPGCLRCPDSTRCNRRSQRFIRRLD
jgi:hypothetical protein